MYNTLYLPCIAATLTNCEIKKGKHTQIKNKKRDGSHKNHPKKNKVKNKKGQPIEKHFKKPKRKLTKKNKNRLLLFWGGGGGDSFSIFSCHAIAALQPPTINQDIHHKTAT